VNDFLEALHQVPLFAGLKQEQLGCLDFIKGGTEMRLGPGERIVNEGDAAAFYVVLEGDLHVLKRVGDSEVLLATHHAGAFFGEVPLLLGTEFFASGQSVGQSRVFRLEDAAFWQMLAACPTVTRTVLQTMAVRVQNMESVSQSREKLVSLGTMAAGLAHELNNPAAASRRSAKELRETAKLLPTHACRLTKQNLSCAQSDFLAAVQRDLAARAAVFVPLDPLARSDREDELSAWLEAHDVADGWQLAPALLEAGLDTAWMEELNAHIPAEALGAVLNWIVATLTVDTLVNQIDESTTRIAALVQAVKAYSYMHQAPRQEADVHEGLESTLTLLNHKLKGVEVTREYDRNLPRLCTYGSELNQVWTNLLDNAIDAVSSKNGEAHVWIRTARDNDHVLVEIADNGTGIAPEAQGRIFEPFFTTKGVGQGTGLGLVISHRIVTGRHGGDISVESQPGDTRFQVRLPLKPHRENGGN